MSVRIFTEETQAFEITPIQYGALEVIRERPGIDQITLASATDTDRTTIMRTIDKLQGSKLVRKQSSLTDRRANILFITPEGEALLDAAFQATEASQQRLMSPLTPKEQAQFLALCSKLVVAHTSSHNTISTAKAQEKTQLAKAG